LTTKDVIVVHTLMDILDA